MIAYTHGQLWNAEMIARSLGKTAPAVTRYIDYLHVPIYYAAYNHFT
jgi:hypothetical protein